MTDLTNALKDLRRPRLLIRAARHGLTEYRRERDLLRLIRGASLPSPDRALGTLLAEEADIEATRRAGDARYSVTRHVELLIAMMGELRLLSRAPG